MCQCLVMLLMRYAYSPFLKTVLDVQEMESMLIPSSTEVTNMTEQLYNIILELVSAYFDLLSFPFYVKSFLHQPTN